MVLDLKKEKNSETGETSIRVRVRVEEEAKTTRFEGRSVLAGRNRFVGDRPFLSRSNKPVPEMPKAVIPKPSFDPISIKVPRPIAPKGIEDLKKSEENEDQKLLRIARTIASNGELWGADREFYEKNKLKISDLLKSHL